MGGGGDTVIQAPQAPNYAESMRDILTAQVEMAPRVYESEAKYQPLYNVLQANQQAFQAQQSLNMARQAYPQIAEIEAAYNVANRQSELGQLQTSLPAYQQAFNALTPGYAQAVAASGQLAQEAMQQALARPQFTAFESRIADPYGVAKSAFKSAPAGSYAEAVKDFEAANVVDAAGTPKEAGFFKSVQPLQSVAARVGQVPEGAKMATVLSASDAAKSAGAVPKPTKMSAAQTAQAAAKQAGVVPSAQNIQAAQSADLAARSAGEVPVAANVQSVAGPSLDSNIQQLDRNAVEQYIGSMPGMGDYTNLLAQRSRAELEAGRSLTAEEQRMADQAARAAYASRGTALGNQAVAAEVLNRADVANQRYQQRLQNAAQAAGTIQAIYQPALQQSLQRQQLGIEYGLGAQQQAFTQAQTRDVLNQQLQAQRYAQAMGTQGAGFEQAAAKDQMLAQLQAQRFGQLSSTQQAGFEQAQAIDAAMQSLQAQKFAQAMGAQEAGFKQAQTQDVFGRETQAQRYAQLMGIQGTAFEQAGARESLAQQLQQSRYNQLMGQQQLLQGAQAQRYEQAMGREQLRAGTQQSAFQQALARNQAQQQGYMARTQAQAGLAQLGAGTMSQLQAAQAPVLQAFYKQPILQGQEAQSQQTGMMMQQQAGPQYFNPESQTGMGSIYGAYNSQMNLAAAQAQANAGKKSGMMGMLGNLGGSAIGAAGLFAFCWVAREVYGAENPKWLQFREWMLAEADDNLLDAYITHGPKVAEFISDKPALKQMIKTWMDSKIS